MDGTEKTQIFHDFSLYFLLVSWLHLLVLVSISFLFVSASELVFVGLFYRCFFVLGGGFIYSS